MPSKKDIVKINISNIQKSHFPFYYEKGINYIIIDFIKYMESKMTKKFKYIILLFAFGLSFQSQANQSVIELIDAFRINGTSLKSNVQEFDASLKEFHLSMRCEKQDNPDRKSRHRVIPKNSFRNCIVQQPNNLSNWQRYFFKSHNGNTKKISYEGSSFPKENLNLIQQVDDLYNQLNQLNLSREELIYSSGDIKGASSPTFFQELTVKQKEYCKDFPVTVSLKTRIMTNPTENKVLSVKVELKRDESNQCDRPKRVQKNKKNN